VKTKQTTSILLASLLAVLTLHAENPGDFTLESPTHDTKFYLSASKGKHVTLHFLLKTECPFCLKHTHDYAELAASTPNVVHVFIKPDSAEEIKEWYGHLRQDGLKKPPVIYRDAGAKLAQAFGIPDGYRFHGQVVHYPALVLLGPDGKEIFRYVGKSNADRMSVPDFVKKLAETQQTAAEQKLSAVAWLKAQAAPRFKPGHTLPLLGQMHCVNPPAELRAELARNWGFAVRLNRPHGEPELIGLCKENPAVFKPAAMIGNLANLEGSKSIAWPEGTFLRKADGALVDGRQIFSPEMPDTAWGIIIDEALRQIEGQLGGLPPGALTTIENWTEYGLTVPIEMARHAAQDPKVLAAKGSRSWQEYTSERKAYYERKFAQTLRKAYPQALHTAYTYAGFSGKPEGDWAWEWRQMKGTTDLPSPECYYNYFNSGFVGSKDMLTLRLQGRHLEIQEGSPHYYGWLCAGYQRNIKNYQGDPAQGMYSDLPRWMGYLKMSYLAGMLGGVTTGEFDCNVKYEPFGPSQPPHWLDQMTVLAHAHALFTWIEADLRNSQLLPGPQPHAWSKDQPAYEFPTDHQNTRALVRRISGTARWLIGAWAADGVERQVSISVPDLGDYRILARRAGTIYLVERTGETTRRIWLDEDAMKPSLKQ
jgi:peroxiredoxin Q/BCP